LKGGVISSTSLRAQGGTRVGIKSGRDKVITVRGVESGWGGAYGVKKRVTLEKRRDIEDGR